ncbi:iron-siderophore ABC transporter substrate-binding protein [Microbacterium sp. Au-Mic1]|uniref:ABC transporter substrate-binding protein n=1 Tax=Microbacterium sp. Au-Mic1 TaxID=2906457 RepID=UPI001E57F015|nr:iron-siderophore ABC transporter substrate-binding protein [Microbacterium sp. Au-Mic1]MCE4026738.1 iron-siderophore ABC transporter substrate-binding protein [Microbacterium sp. Au-Mic1]
MRKPLAVLSLLAASTLALAGCGTTSVAAPTGSAAPAASAECATDATATSTGPVTMTDALGRTVKLDKPAERVAVLEWQQVEDALTLCVTPVAVADAAGYRQWDKAETLPEGVKDVGTRQEPNLDALFQTKPDLVIVEAQTRDDAIIGQLEKYGVPVLVTVGADAKDPVKQLLATFDLIAQATGRTERAADVATEMKNHLAEAKKTLAAAKPSSTDFVYFDGWVDGGTVSLRPFGTGSLIGAIGGELGLTNVWKGETDPAYGLGSTDVEGMTTVGSATLLHTGTDDPDSDSFIAAAEKNPAWASIPAVKEKRIHAFPTGIWTFGGPRSAEKIADAYVDAFRK